MNSIELPRLSNALRKFGNFSANYDEIEDSRFQIYEIPTINLSWDEFEVLTRELCDQKSVSKVKQCCKKLLQTVNKIIGSEERAERKKTITVLLIARLYKQEKILLKTVSDIQKDIVEQMNMETLQNFNQVLVELMDCCDTYVMQDKLEEILEKPKTMFGENIKFCCKLPELPRITEAEFQALIQPLDSDNNKDVVSSLSNMMDSYKNKAQNEPAKKEPPKPFSVFKIYNKLCSNIQDIYGSTSDGVLQAVMNVLRSNQNLQEGLCDLLGFERFDLIAEMLQNREQILKEEELALAQKRLEEIETSKNGSRSKAIMTSSEREAEKRRRKEKAKLGKFISKNAALGGPSLDRLDFDKMKEQRKDDLRTSYTINREGMLEKVDFSKKIILPNVFDAKQSTTLQQFTAMICQTKMALPAGAERNTHQNYEEFKLPASKSFTTPPWDLVKITDGLDEMAQLAFGGIKRLNVIQSKVFPTAFHSNENMLICAPTGAGKTNVAMLTIVREVMNNIEDGILKLNSFKIVYVAPMKALAAEMAESFGRRLAPLGLVVRELTGDMNLTKSEIHTTQMLVVTPEKWDVMTRKSTGDIALARLVKLLIIDEVHLLHDERGPVIETIVARTLRQVEQQQSMIRIVGLSATLPNYIDVANFLRVNLSSGLFFFDGRFRPVPLQQNFMGVKSTSIMGQRRQMDEACYDKVVENLKKNEQVLVFVHARNATVTAAESLAHLAHENGESSLFVNTQMELQGYTDALNKVQLSRNKILHKLFTKGIGIHHAGLLRKDRTMMERVFAAGMIRVLCCTSTLAWGVNLPAHAVVIKGTQYYDAKQGSFVDLGILDVMQIFGRAGRPQFDTTGEATIITTHEKLSRYISLMTRQNPIESQFVERLIDNLNAEISLGTVNNIEDAVKWLSYTYLFVRIKKNPLVYGISYQDCQDDPGLRNWQVDLCKRTARHLDKLRMIRFDVKNGYCHPTDLGRTASHYYIKYESIDLYNKLIKPEMNINEILAMISKSSEFTQIKVRDDEMQELDDLMHEYCPASGRIVAEDTDGKANILFQTFVSRGPVRSFSLMSDMTYIQQNASRIVRAVFEIVLKRGMAKLSSRVLKLCKCVDRRMWPWDSELRQFGFHKLTADVLRKIEGKSLDATKLRELTSGEIGNVLHHPSIGSKVKHLVNQIPYLHMETQIQPITRTILKISLTITPEFNWDNHSHGSKHESFWVWVEDPDTDTMYHSEYFFMPKKQVVRHESHNMVFTIPLNEPHPTQYMVYIESDRWFGSTCVCPVSFQHLILPEQHPPHTELLDLEPLPTTALEEKKFIDIYKFTHFNPIQTQIFHCLYHNDTNALVGAPTGSGKTVAGELALFRMLREHPGCKCVYIAPLKALVRERMKDWGRRLEKQLDIKLVELTGDVAPDMKAVARSDVIITTPEKWDGISRSWATRDYVRKVTLLIIDEIHLLGQDRGPVLEVIVSRTNFISSQTNHKVRIVGLSTALANARDLADWLGIKQMGLFNFRPSVRPVPMETHIHGFAGKHYCPRMALMNKPCFQAIKTHSPTKPTLVFVSSRRQTRLTALDLIAYLAAEDNPKQWLSMDEFEVEQATSKVRDPNLKFTLSFGIGLHHAGLVERDRSIVEDLFGKQKIQTLIATSTLAWGVNLPAHLVIVKGTEYFDGKTNRYHDFPITDVLQMMGRAGRPQFDDKAVACIFVHDVKKPFYKKFLYEPFPVESSLLDVVQDHLNAEIVAGTICNNQEAIDYLTWTYFFRRLLMNPSYYNLIDCEHDSVNEYLSRLLQQAISVLRTSACVAMPTDNEDCPDQLQSTNFGRIASYYYLSHLTMRMLNDDMRNDMNIEEVLEILSQAQEYNELPVRHNEDSVNSELAKELPVKFKLKTFEEASTKSLLLLYAHFSRTPLPSTDYVTDLKTVLDQSIRILQAFVDASADRGWASTSVRCMHCIQMISQAAWHHYNPLLTLPNTTQDHIDLFDQLNMGTSLAMLAQKSRSKQGSQEIRYQLSEIYSKDHLEKVMSHLQKLPLIDVSMSLSSTSDENNISQDVPPCFGKSLLDDTTWVDVEPDTEYLLNVKLKRMQCLFNKKLDDKSLTPRFPKPKLEGWFLVVLNKDTRELIALKRVATLRSRGNESLLFLTPQNNNTKVVLTFMLVSDSYIGLDQTYDVRIQTRQTS